MRPGTYIRTPEIRAKMAAGVTLTLPQWAERVGIDYNKLHHRVHRYGWPIERALEVR